MFNETYSLYNMICKLRYFFSEQIDFPYPISLLLDRLLGIKSMLGVQELLAFTAIAGENHKSLSNEK